MLLPSLSMVFDGSGPLVKRCDGFDGSLWSTLVYRTFPWCTLCTQRSGLGSYPLVCKGGGQLSWQDLAAYMVTRDISESSHSHQPQPPCIWWPLLPTRFLKFLDHNHTAGHSHDGYQGYLWDESILLPLDGSLWSPPKVRKIRYIQQKTKVSKMSLVLQPWLSRLTIWRTGWYPPPQHQSPFVFVQNTIMSPFCEHFW